MSTIAPRVSGIYMLTSPSGKRYVGKSVNIRKRLCEYRCQNPVNIGRVLLGALRKYTWAQWRKEVLVLAPRSELSGLEIKFIALYNTCHGPGYNCTEGGDGKIGCICSAETRARMSAAQKGKKRSAETRARMSAAQKRRQLLRPASAETRARMSAAQKGKKRPNKGRKHSAEARANMRAGQKRRRARNRQLRDFMMMV